MLSETKLMEINMSDLPLIKTRTIQSFSNDLLLKVIGKNEEGRKVGMSYGDVLTKVREEFPEANTTIKCLQWYNSKLKKGDKEVPIRHKQSIL